MPERFALQPSKRTTRLALCLGIILFIPAYGRAFYLVSSEIGAAALAKPLACFDPAVFGAAIREIGRRCGSGALAAVYAMNIASAVGYFLAFGSLSLMIARSMRPASLPRKAAWLFPPSIAFMAVLDIFASILFLALPRGADPVPAWMAYAIDAAYLGRLAILYPVMAWFLAVGAFSLLKTAKAKRWFRGSSE